MKLSLKQGESLRIAHDADAGTFRIFVMEGAIHITANAPGEATDIALDDAVKSPSSQLNEQEVAAAAARAVSRANHARS